MKILLIQFYQTGDVVLTTHIPRELKKIVPDSEIDFLTFTANADIVRHNPYLTNVLTIDRKSGTKGFLKLIGNIRKKKYDAVLDFHDNPRSMYCTIFSGAKIKSTYADSSRSFFYKNPVPKLHGTAVEIKLSLLANFCEKPLELDKQTEIFFTEKETAKIDDIFNNLGINNDDFIVTVSPTHKKDTRRWAFKHFFDTASFLIKQYNAKIIYTYGPGEKEYIDEQLKELGGIKENMYIMPSLSLLEFTALLDRAKLHLGNDSAPHHIATARRVPTFVIIGSSCDGWVFPSVEHTFARAETLDCIACGKSECIHGDKIPCLKEFGFKDMKDDLENFIKNVVLR